MSKKFKCSNCGTVIVARESTCEMLGWHIGKHVLCSTCVKQCAINRMSAAIDQIMDEIREESKNPRGPYRAF